MKKSKSQVLKETTQYFEFLEKRINSENYKRNVSPEEFAKTKAKYEKTKFLLKTLKYQR